MLTPPPWSRSCSKIFLALLALRLCNALLVRTFFQPDEFFQVLEPAWQRVFGNSSGAWLTWEWQNGLRSSLHPWLFAGVYQAARLLAQMLALDVHDRAELLIAAPKVAQAVFAAGIDFFTWKLAKLMPAVDGDTADIALCLTICSPWQWFFSGRTMSNGVETALSIAALYHWQCGLVHWSSYKPAHWQFGGAIALAVTACELRPTNVIIWAVVACDTFYKLFRLPDGAPYLFAKQLLLRHSVHVLAILAITAVLDHAMHGTWEPPIWRFVNINFFQSLAEFYGTNRLLYYVVEGLPMLLTTALPFALAGIWYSLSNPDGRVEPDAVGHQASPRQRNASNSNEGAFLLDLRSLTGIASAVMIVLSVVTHKEVRFIYPLMPLLHILATGPVATFFGTIRRPRSGARVYFLALILAINVVLAAYMSLIHQRGVIDAIHFLRDEHERKYISTAGDTRQMTVGFMMPCHSTPWRSHLVHRTIKAWALTCEPPLNLSRAERETYRDEADQFYDHTEAWLDLHMRSAGSTEVRDTIAVRSWPEYLAFFEALEPTMKRYFEDATRQTQVSYRECWRAFNSHFHDDWRRRGDIIIWCSTTPL